ncbi:response regulator [Allosphingosinicella indica]|uniref:response regulator n=1 Tax=Allosphingosinicella indica TaxID=941907 RepID=UPI000A15FE03|nr:response regulator [Allosphingosinicella indica]
MNGGEKVLVVDDDEDVRATIRQLLETLGYAPIEAADGDAAIALLKEERPDVVILDYAMPGMDGAELARRAKDIHPGIPVIFASGFAEERAIKKAVGPDVPLLHKPFQLAEMAELIEQRLKHPAR